MITGDPALDAWLAAHGHFLAAAIIFAAVVAIVLPGLVVLLGEDEPPAPTRPASSNRKSGRVRS
jgi:hypothetical protein